MGKYINKYGTAAEYASDGSRPSDSSAVSAVGNGIVIDGINVIAPFSTARIGDHAFLDKTTGKRIVIRGGTLRPDYLDADRYVNLRHVCVGRIYGRTVFVQYDRLPAEQYAVGDEWTVGGFDFTKAGSAKLVIKTYGAAAANTYTADLAWSVGDTIDDIIKAIKAVSGLTSYAVVSKIDDETIGIVVNGYNASMGVIVSDGDVVATRTYRGYQTQYYGGLKYGTQILGHNGVLASSAFACFDKFFDYYRTYGTAEASTIGGDTVNEGAFNETTNPVLFNTFGGDYNAYMAAQFDAIRTEVPTARSGLFDMAFGDECSAVLADVTHTKFDGSIVHDFPNAYSASLAGVTVDGFNTGFEPGTGHLGGLAEAQLLFGEINRGKNDVINVSIVEGGGTAVTYDTTIRLAFQSSANGAWLFRGNHGSLYGGAGRIGAYCARVFRAFNIDEL